MMKNLLVKDWMQTQVVLGEAQMGMLDAHKMMTDRQIRRLPVVDEHGVLIGMVTRSDIRKAEPSGATSLNMWELNYLLAKLKLKDIMTKDVLTCHADDTIKTAALLMQENKIGAVPVVDGKRKVVGIITESDIFRVLVAWFNEEVGEA
ncbi:MAG: CBS domain-containing protein [Ardenticatenaceae bacterium]|nr:CBS domain-containing protein [Ardenticatenaceae bacterium]